MQCFHFYRKEEKMHAIFQAIAPRYNCLNRTISFFHDQYWRRKAVEQANFAPHAKLLDICCGTGRLTQELLRHGDETGRITGLDFSANMLREAEANLRYHPRCRQVSWIHGNALHLPFADASFDGVSIAFGLYSVAGTEQAIAALQRAPLLHQHVEPAQVVPIHAGRQAQLRQRAFLAGPAQACDVDRSGVHPGPCEAFRDIIGEIAAEREKARAI